MRTMSASELIQSIAPSLAAIIGSLSLLGIIKAFLASAQTKKERESRLEAFKNISGEMSTEFVGRAKLIAAMDLCGVPITSDVLKATGLLVVEKKSSKATAKTEVAQ